MAARDQAARVLRAEPKSAEGERDAANDSAVLAEQLRTHVADEAKRRPAETPEAPPSETPAATPVAPDAPAATAAPKKSGRRKVVMIGF